MRGLPYNGSPSADIYTQVKLIFQIQEFDGKYQKELELYLQRGQFAQGSVEVELNEDTKNIFKITFIPTTKTGKTKPALIEARNKLGNAVNDWYLKNVK